MSKQRAKLLKARLERAAYQGKRDLAQKMVGAGADIGVALHAAARGGHTDVANDLLENGASIAAKDASRDGNTPLHAAAMEGKTEAVQLLLLKGADKDALNDSKLTPLYLAAENGHVASALALLAAGADVSLRHDISEISVVNLAARRGYLDIMRAAIERGADVNAVDRQRSENTPLLDVVCSDDAEAIDLLVEAGANMEARDCHGFTPLHLAAFFEKPRAIRALVGAGACIEALDPEGCTPLHLAAGQASVEASLALVEHGANVNAQNQDQDTPLHRAARASWESLAAKVIDSLLRSGADETILNNEGEAAVDVVRMDGKKHDLLVYAPADRAWRRRGYLVLCRAYPDRVQQIQDIASAHTSMARRTRSSARLGRAETGSCTLTAGDGTPVDGRAGDSWVDVAARMLVLQEEDVFRAIVGCL